MARGLRPVLGLVVVLVVALATALPTQLLAKPGGASSYRMLEQRVEDWARRSFAVAALSSAVVPGLLEGDGEGVRVAALSRGVALAMQIMMRLANPPVLLLHPVSGNLSLGVESVGIPPTGAVQGRCLEEGVYVLGLLSKVNSYVRNFTFSYRGGVLVEKSVIGTALGRYIVFETRSMFTPVGLEAETLNYVAVDGVKRFAYAQRVSFIDGIPVYMEVRFPGNRTLVLRLGDRGGELVVNSEARAVPPQQARRLLEVLRRVGAMPSVSVAYVPTPLGGGDVYQADVTVTVAGRVDLGGEVLTINASATTRYLVLGPYAIPTRTVINHLYAEVAGGGHSCRIVLENPIATRIARVLEASVLELGAR